MGGIISICWVIFEVDENENIIVVKGIWFLENVID